VGGFASSFGVNQVDGLPLVPHIPVRVIWMLGQLVGKFAFERANDAAGGAPRNCPSN
jgi:hypothetical protein